MVKEVMQAEVREAGEAVGTSQGRVLAGIVSAQSAGTKNRILLVDAVSIKPVLNVGPRWYANSEDDNLSSIISVFCKLDASPLSRHGQVIEY
jgi:hypothetical protein